MARALVLFFGLELPDTIAYKLTEAFVDFNFTFLFIHVKYVQILRNTWLLINENFMHTVFDQVVTRERNAGPPKKMNYKHESGQMLTFLEKYFT